MNFYQFKEALELIAEKKYPEDADGLSKLEDKIVVDIGPMADGPTVCVINKYFYTNYY